VNPDEEKRDRQLIELLQELRIALPGVQLLFGFLLTVPFTQRFAATTAFQRNIYYVTLIAAACSTICFIAPSAVHRLRFHHNDRAYVIESANKLTIAGLVFLAVALICAVLLITDFLYSGPRVALYVGAVALLLIVLWFVRPLYRAVRGLSSGP
jgi:magnesium-transporting ATPase (P-type)